MADEIEKYLKIKDFYELLGLEKDATEEQIKKSYRKLALKFHPDKHQGDNKEKAQEVFKKIAQAYDCLSNKEKRSFYDRHGSDDPQSYQQQFNQDFSPDDIFKFFFGEQGAGGMGGGLGSFFDEIHRQGGQSGSFGGNTFYFSTSFGGPGGFQQRRTYYSNGQQQQAEDEDSSQQRRHIGGGRRYQAQPQRKGGILTLCQYLPILIIMFSWFFNSSVKQEQFYQMSYSSTFSDQRATQYLKVPYYVNEYKFSRQVETDNDKLKKLEFEIEQTYIQDLSEKCTRDHKQKRNFQQQSQMAKSQKDKEFYLNKAKQYNMFNCNELDKLKDEYNIGQYLY